jgi:hypothetical protein
MITRATVLALGCSAFVFGCSAEQTPADEQQEIIDNLVQAGFPADDIMVVDGKVYTGRDAHVTLEASREMLVTDGASAEQYRTTNLVSTSITKICINPSAAFSANATLMSGLALARDNYNALPLTFDFQIGGTGCGASIAITTTSGAGGSAGFPSGGKPYPGNVFIGTGTTAYGVDVVEHVITHELGHCVGFRHSDYYNRAISCGGAASNEGTAGVGAVLIPGTPSTTTVGASIMNSCFRSVESGEFTSTDVTALNTLY